MREIDFGTFKVRAGERETVSLDRDEIRANRWDVAEYQPLIQDDFRGA
jgi:hypothetical protein